MELTSPVDIAKQYVLAVQEYSLLAWRALTNLFSAPSLPRRHHVAGRFDRRRLASPSSSSPVFSPAPCSPCKPRPRFAHFGAISHRRAARRPSMIKELGPVLTSLMVAGRNASGMASELGSMKVTEQLDAMRALGTDPMKKLVTPRVTATIFMLFFLTIISDLMGLGRRLDHLHLVAWPQHRPVLDLRLPEPGLRRHHPGTHQTFLLRLHHRHHRLLLRHEHQGRHAGRGTLHHPGRRRRLRPHPRHRFLHHPLVDGRLSPE